jgi:hypothetical protein
MSANRHLKSLDLSCNLVAGSAWHAELAAALAAHPALEEVNVRATGMTVAGATALGAALQTNTTLKTLNAVFNDGMTDAGAEVLWKAAGEAGVDLDL